MSPVCRLVPCGEHAGPVNLGGGPPLGLVSQFFDCELGNLERVLDPTLTNLDYLLGNQLRDWVIPVLHRESAQGQLVGRSEPTGSLPLDPLVPQHSINGHDSLPFDPGGLPLSGSKELAS